MKAHISWKNGNIELAVLTLLQLSTASASINCTRKYQGI